MAPPLFCLASTTLLGCVAMLASGPSSAPSSRDSSENMRDQWHEEHRLGRMRDLGLATAAELKAYCAAVAEVNTKRLVKELAITSDQDVMVQNRMRELTEESAAHLLQHQAELREIRNRMMALRGDAAGRDQVQSLSRRQGEILQGLPLHYRKVSKEIEKLLPPEQVEAARVRRHARNWDLLADRYKKLYELTPEQLGKVKDRLDACKPENEAYWKENAAEADRLSDEIRVSMSGAQGFRDPKLLELSEKHRKLQENQPCAPAQLDAEIEAMLPSEQVKAARGRMAGPDMMRDGMAEAFDEMARLRAGQAMRGRPASRPSKLPRLRAFARTALGNWELYVKWFIEAYALNADQQATAHSILREAQKQRSEYEREHQVEVLAARKLENREERVGILKELNEPVAMIFDRLKEKLEKIPTAAQRAQAEKDAGALQPVTQPAGAASSAWLSR